MVNADLQDFVETIEFSLTLIIHVCIMYLCMFLSQQKYWYDINLIDNVWHMITIVSNIYSLNISKALV